MRKQSIWKFLIISLSLIILLVISDIIYFYNNGPEKVGRLFIFISQKLIDSKRPQLAIKSLNTAGYFYFLQNQKLYKKKFPVIFPNLNSLEIETLVQKEIHRQTLKYFPKVSEAKSQIILSNLYYNLGLILTNRGFGAKAENYFQSAILLQPELSFIHIEFANYYLNYGNYSEGIKKLEFCLQFAYPRKHCSEYLENNAKKRNYHELGFYRNKLAGYQGLQN